MKFLTREIPKFLNLCTAFATAGLIFSLLLPLGAYASVPRAKTLTPVAPSGEWVTLGPRATREYSFKYSYNGTDKPSEVAVLLDSYQAGTFSFEVIRYDNRKKIGSGAVMSKFTQNAGDSSKLIWIGSMQESATFIVIVKNLQDIPNTYLMMIDGADVSFPSETTDADGFEKFDEVVEADSIPIANIRPGPAFSKTGIKKLDVPATPVPGSSPDTALAPENEWITLAPNETRWYSFKYDFDQHSGASSVAIYLDTEVINALSFDVMTSDMVIFGASTPRDTSNGVSWEDLRLIWTSRTLISGRYFVEIKNRSELPASFKLDIAGKDVS